MWGWCLRSVVPRGCGDPAGRLQRGHPCSCLHPQAPGASSIPPPASGVSALLRGWWGCWHPGACTPSLLSLTAHPVRAAPGLGFCPSAGPWVLPLPALGKTCLARRVLAGPCPLSVEQRVPSLPWRPQVPPLCRGLRAQGCSKQGGGCRPTWAADMASGIRETSPRTRASQVRTVRGRTAAAELIKSERPTLLPCCSLRAWDQRGRGSVKGMEGGTGDGGPWWIHPSPGTSQVQGDSSPGHGAEQLPSAPLFEELISLMKPPRPGPCAAAAGSGQRIHSADLQPLCAGPATEPAGNYSLISATCCGQRARPAGTHTMRSCK